jgi:hypothetical protein
MTTEPASKEKIIGVPRANDTRVAQQLGQGINTWVFETKMSSRR